MKTCAQNAHKLRRSGPARTAPHTSDGIGGRRSGGVRCVFVDGRSITRACKATMERGPQSRAATWRLRCAHCTTQDTATGHGHLLTFAISGGTASL